MIKENLLGKYQNDMEIKNKKSIPKNLFSLKITKHLKTIKIDLLALKTLLKTLLKHSRSQEKFAPKNLAKNPKRWGLYRPIRKLAVRAELAALTGNGRPARSTANGRKYDRWATAVDRPGRPKQTESTVSAPVDPSGRPSQCLQTCTDLCTSVDRPGRPTPPLVD